MGAKPVMQSTKVIKDNTFPPRPPPQSFHNFLLKISLKVSRDLLKIFKKCFQDS